MAIIKYKDYEGTVEVDISLGICRGKVLFINDLVTYQSKEIGNIQREFAAAVDDYLETCKELGRKPQAPFKGVFQVRVTPELHRALSVRAVVEETSLNEVVSRACSAYTCSKDITHSHNHHHTFTINIENSSTITEVMSSGSDIKWQGTKYAH